MSQHHEKQIEATLGTIEIKHSLGLRSVLIAVLGNTLVAVAKFGAFILTGSGVILSEAIHSLADIANQVLLFIGISRAEKPADESYNYGYRSERFFWSLISACGVFFLGAGVTIYQGLHSLLNPETVLYSNWSILVLLVSLILESISLFSAFSELRSSAGTEKLHVYARHSGDPTLLAVIYEDSAAVVGITIAFVSIMLTHLTGMVFWDGLGSIGVGVLLGGVAISLMAINRELLLGKAIPKHIHKKIFTILANEGVVDEIHDFKTVMITTDGYRVKAEVEINGHYLADKIFESRDFHKEYEDIKDYRDFVKFCAEFSDEVTRTLGKEIDLVEKKIEDSVPNVEHIDIETN